MNVSCQPLAIHYWVLTCEFSEMPRTQEKTYKNWRMCRGGKKITSPVTSPLAN